MKSGKASGLDDIPIEALIALSEDNIELITNLCNTIYNSGYIPMEIRKSIFLPIPEKPKAQNCTDFRTISLMSHVTKLLLKIIQIRIKDRIDKEISKLQSGFTPARGTREGIFNIRTICERAIEVGKDVYICFVDYSKVFDMVKHSKMTECLKKIGLDGKDLQIITKLYWDQTVAVRTESRVSTEYEIKKGVRQGCVLSPSLFNLYTEKIYRKVEHLNGVKRNGININKLRYADDTALCGFAQTIYKCC